MGEVFTEEAFFDAADAQSASAPIADIKFVGVSVQQYSDISIVLRAVNLQIAIFRLCGFTAIPREFFALHELRSVDLSGNAIALLPPPDEFESLPHLRTLNLTDNVIHDIAQVMHLSGLRALRQLSVTGNPCATLASAFDRIVHGLKTLDILNDSIITSQYRAYLDGLAVSAENSNLPLTRLDDFIVLYVKYMHAGSTERYVRRSNAEFFCLNHVLRRFSSAEKIQSIFRGFRDRTHYRKMKAAAILIQTIVRRWYQKRLNAAAQIRKCWFKYCRKREKRYIIAVKRVQSAWRRMNSRIHAFVDAFEMTDSFELFLTPDHWKSLHDLMIEHSLPEPGKVERSSYKLIRLGEPRALQLPGSPTMYFMMDGSALVRRVRTGGPLPARGVWCGHIHTDDPGRVKVTRAGINPVAHCLFSQLKGPEFFVKKSGGARNARGSGHLMLLKITFTDRKAFQRLIEMARAHLKIRLFCKPALEWASAHLVIQSAMRTFIQRMNFFKSAKQHVLEARARRTLRVGLIKMNCFGITRHVAAVGRYHQTIRGTRAFFVTESFLAKVAKMPVLRQVPFGYSRERTVVLSDEANGALRCLIPTGNIVFALSDVDHLLRVGTLISPISPKAFPMSIPTKWLTRSKILRISMIQPDEADRRMVLFAWMTGNTSGLMTEKGVVEFCAAAAIKAAWLGYILRSTAMRSLARQVSRQTKRPALSVGPQKSTLESGMVVVVKPHQSIEADEMIHSIRRDYRPWITEFEKFKAMKAVETPRKETEPVVEEVSQSAKNLGMVSNHELSMAISLRRPVVGPVTHDLTDIDPRTTFLTGSPTQKIRPTAKPAPVREVLRGAQRTDNTERIRQQNAFTRLARLHQLGAEIEQGAVVDHTIEEKRAVASHARSQLAISRNERAQSRDVFIDEVRSRSRIERDELFDELEEQNYQSTKLRTRRIQKLKEDRRSQQQRLDRDKKFGIAFVNVSRQLGHANERMILRDRQSAQRAALAESTAGLRESVLQSRFNARERLFEIEHQRHRVAELDRIITNARHQERLGHRDERLRAVHEQKRRDALHDLPKMLRHALPPPVACPVRRDEQEEATAELGEWVGANLGAMEARALVDLLAGVLA